jgi:hypothetical protein
MNPTESNQVKSSIEKLLRLTIKGTYRGISTSSYRINAIIEDIRVSYKENLNLYGISFERLHLQTKHFSNINFRCSIANWTKSKQYCEPEVVNIFLNENTQKTFQYGTKLPGKQIQHENALKITHTIRS